MLDSFRETLRERIARHAGAGEGRRYEVLSQELRAMILAGELRVGDPLPAERELVELTGLGRGSVREAIRILESEGLLTPKMPGRKGLSVVQNAPTGTVARQLELFISGETVSNDDLMQARLLIEPGLARIAAGMRTEEDIAGLSAINDRIIATGAGDRAALVRLNLEWHTALSRASHNALLIAIATGLTETQHQAGVMEIYGSAEHARVMGEAHGRILEAVIARDGDRAERRMRKHLQGYADTLARLNPARFDITRLNPR